MLIEPLRLWCKQKIVRNLCKTTTSSGTEIPDRNTQIKRSILALYEMGTLDLESTQALITAFGVGDA
jgi:hypothetical protein